MSSGDETPTGDGEKWFTTEDVDSDYESIFHLYETTPLHLSDRAIAQLVLTLVDERLSVPVADTCVRVLSQWAVIVDSPQYTFHAKLQYDSAGKLLWEEVQAMLETIDADHNLLLITSRELSPVCRYRITDSSRIQYIGFSDDSYPAWIDRRYP